MSGCCPSGSIGYLASASNGIGQVVEVSGTEMYVVGQDSGSKNGIVIVPDVWGKLS